MTDYWQGLSESVSALARDAVSSGGVRVYVKTNFGPEFPVSGGDGPGLAELVGLKAGVVVRDRRGAKLASYGGYPPTDPARVALLLALAGLLGFVLIRGVFKR